MPTEPPPDLRIAVLALRQTCAELLAAHREGEDLYEHLPRERRERVDRRPDVAYREELIQMLAFAPPEERRRRRQWVVDVITNIDALLDRDRPGMDARDLALLQRATAALQVMALTDKREIDRFFEAAENRSESKLVLRSTSRGRIKAHFEADET